MCSEMGLQAKLARATYNLERGEQERNVSLGKQKSPRAET